MSTTVTSAAAAEFARRQQSPLQRVQHQLHGKPWLSPLFLLLIAFVAFYIATPTFLTANSMGILLQQTAVVGALAVGPDAGHPHRRHRPVGRRDHGAVDDGDGQAGQGPAACPASSRCSSASSSATAPAPLNGLLVTRINLPPFIVTLGTLSIFTAIALLYSGGESIQADQLPGLLNWTGNGVLASARSGSRPGASSSCSSSTSSSASRCARRPGAGTCTPWATTPSRPASPASRASGSCCRVYTVAGLIYGIAAWILIGRAGAASPNAVADANLDSITAVVIGGTSLFGGRGGVVGTLIGALIVAAFDFGLSLAGRRPAVPGPRHRRPRHRRRRGRPVDQEGQGMSIRRERRPRAASPAAKQAVDGPEPVLEARRPGQDLRPGRRPRRRRPRPLPRRGARGHRRQRCRQVHADQVPVRRLRPRRRRDHARRRAGRTSSGRRTPARPASRRSTRQLAVIPALDIASNLYLAREERRKGPLGSVLRMLDKKGMEKRAGESVQNLGIQTIQNMSQAVETLSGGQRQAVAVARAAAFGSKVVVLDEPTAALGVKESGMVLDMIKQLRDNGPADHPDQPQHAARVGGRRPHPHPAARRPGRCHHARRRTTWARAWRS